MFHDDYCFLNPPNPETVRQVGIERNHGHQKAYPMHEVPYQLIQGQQFLDAFDQLLLAFLQ